MNLGEHILQRAADWRPAGRQTLNIPDDGSGWAAAVTADRADELGVRVWEATFRRSEPRPGGAESLRGWGERAARRVTGLLEPLRLLEVDGSRDEAVLRSDAPARKDEQLFYYEVALKGAGEATVRRYAGSHEPGTRREQVPFALTHEALAKLADDLAAEA